MVVLIDGIPLNKEDTDLNRRFGDIKDIPHSSISGLSEEIGRAHV